MKYFALPLLVLLSTMWGTAQNLIPFPGANGLYGFASPEGKVVTPPQFRQAWLPDQQGFVFAADTGNMLHVIRPDGSILPAAIPCSPNSRAPVAVPAINYLNGPGKADTLDGFWCVRDASMDGYGAVHHYLMLKKTADGVESRVYQGDLYLDATANFWETDFLRRTAPYFTFSMELSRVVKGPHRVNFLNNRHFKEIFEQDYDNGTLISPEYIVLSNEAGKMALADTTGHILTGFDFDWIAPAPRKGFFHVCQRDKLEPPSTNIYPTSIIARNGQSILDSAFRFPQAVNERWIIALRDQAFGLIDYEGNTVLPFNYWSLDYIRDSLFVSENKVIEPQPVGERQPDPPLYHIIDIHGSDYLPQAMYRIWHNSEGPDYFEVTTNYESQTKWIMDSSFHLVFRDTFERVYGQPDGRFFVTVNYPGHPGRKLNGILENNGRPVLPAEFELIYPQKNNAGFLVKRDSLWGFYTRDGRPVFPCKYGGIVPEETDSLLILWVNPYHNKSMFTPYSVDGKRLSFPKRINPRRALNPKSSCILDYGDGHPALILPNGTIRPLPYNYSNYLRLADTPYGSMFVKEPGTNYQLLNTSMKPIVPKGFYLPPYEFPIPYHQPGLIPVHKENVSGIINIKGKWVKKPGRFRYQVLSPDTFLEYADRVDSAGQKPVAIYTLTRSGKRRMKIDFADNKFQNGRLVIGRWAKIQDTTLMLYALRDSIGQKITPFMFKKPPERWQIEQAAQVYAKDGAVKNVIIDASVRVILDYGDRPIASYDPRLHWVYFKDNAGNTSVEDTSGREILPAHYKELWWILPGKLFAAALSPGNYQVCTATGRQLLSGIGQVRNARELDAGYSAVLTDSRCFIFDADFNLVCAESCEAMETLNDFPDLLCLKSKASGSTGAQQSFYVNYKKGVVFRE